MTVLRGLAVFLFCLPAIGMGAIVVRRSWGFTRSHGVWVLGSVVGLSIHLIALNILSYLLMPSLVAWILAALECLYLILYRKDLFQTGAVAPEDNGTRRGVRLSWLILSPIILIWIWKALAVGTTDQLFHAASSQVLAHSGLPGFHPYDTSQTFVYHHGLNIFGASLGSAVGLNPWWAMNVLVALLVPVALGSCLEFIMLVTRRMGREASCAELLGGTLLFMLGGNLTWVEVLAGKRVFLETGRFDFACDGFASLFAQPSQVATWGWVFGVLCLALAWPNEKTTKAGSEGIDKNKARMFPCIPFGLTVAAVPLLSEQAALAIGVALGALTIHKLITRMYGWQDLLLAGGLALGIALFQGGVLTGMSLGLSGASTLHPEWREAWLPTFPSQNGAVGWGHTSYLRVFLVEYAHTLLFLPLFVALIFLKKGSAPARWILGCTIPGAVLALYVKLPINDWDIYRLYQMYFCAAMLSTGLLLGGLWDVKKKEAAASGTSLEGLGRSPTIRWLALIMAALLCVQGIRSTAIHADYAMFSRPWAYDVGQAQALKKVEAEGGVQDGILCHVYRDRVSFRGMPPTPGVLGQPVPVTDPGADVQIVRGRSWLRALSCPSPWNLRNARTRWICLGGEDLSAAVPILEGSPSFQPFGIFQGDRAYRLYRYTDSWDIAQDTLSNLVTLKRYPIFAATIKGKGLPEDQLKALGDGDPETAVTLRSEALSADGLLLIPKPTADRKQRTVSFVWIQTSKPVAQLKSETSPFGLEVLQGTLTNKTQRKWADPLASSKQKSEIIHDPKRPRAWGFYFSPRQALAIRIRMKAFSGNRKKIHLSEVYIGQAELLEDIEAIRFARNPNR